MSTSYLDVIFCLCGIIYLLGNYDPKGISFVFLRVTTVVFGVWATSVQLYLGRDTFEFDQGHVTKNQPITVLVLLSENRGI